MNNRPERRTPFTAVDNTGGETTVELGLQQLWSDAKSIELGGGINICIHFAL